MWYWYEGGASLSDKKKREISDYLNDTLTNPCGQKFAKTTLPSNTENMSNVGSNEKNSSDINITIILNTNWNEQYSYNWIRLASHFGY
jgi:hypothetical protein